MLIEDRIQGLLLKVMGCQNGLQTDTFMLYFKFVAVCFYVATRYIYEN